MCDVCVCGVCMRVYGGVWDVCVCGVCMRVYGGVCVCVCVNSLLIAQNIRCLRRCMIFYDKNVG